MAEASFEIVTLNPKLETAYEKFLTSNPANLLYASVPYRNLISTHTGCQSHYFLALDESGEIAGAFPLMILPNEKFGPVANSLPYFGSNGAVAPRKDLSPETLCALRGQLLKAVVDKVEQEGCVSSTLISNPLDPDYSSWLRDNFHHDYEDFRYGLITPLPTDAEDTGQALLDSYEDPRPRNIRKAIKEGIEVSASNDQEDLDSLYRVHKDNIESMGGLAKTQSFFQLVKELIPEKYWKIHIARREGEPVGGLLVFYYNKTVEYYTPAAVSEHRNAQPGALIIYEAMKDAVAKGFQYWNWGGTWESQEGLYGFKKKWGARENNYHYYTRLYNPELKRLGKEGLLREYPNMYVVPFENC